MKHSPLRLFAVAVFAGLLSGAFLTPRAAANNPSDQAAAKPTGAPSAAEIAAAKARGKVWVNRTTGIYHRRGRWYGKTKDGKFMTADEAKKAGYKPAKRD